MKLYEIPQGSKIKAEVVNGETKESKEELITFHRLDGAYSYCTLPDGGIVHLSASTPLVRKGDHYAIWEPEKS